MKYTISILAHNNLALTKRCVESVLKNSEWGTFKLVLTDNGSSDGTYEYFKSVRQSTNFWVIRNEKNLGFIEPNKTALGNADGEFFVLLNNDCVVPAHWLKDLSAPFAQHPKAALSAPTNGCTELGNDFHGRLGRFEYLEGACLMCKTEIVKQHGLFDPHLVGCYGEDSDMSLRMREQGYTLHQVPIWLEHARGATSAMVPQVREWQELNHTFLRRRWAHYLRVRKMDYPILIRRAGAWGDVLLTTAVIREIKKMRPLSPIWVETDCGEVFQGNPNVARVERRIHMTSDALCIDLNMSYEMKNETHIVEAYRHWCSTALGQEIKLESMVPELFGIREDTSGHKIVCVHVGPVCWQSKEWGLEKFDKLINGLIERDWTVHLVGAIRTGPITHHMDFRTMTPELWQLGNILKAAKLFIGLDSFPLHVAQAVGTPAIGLFGVTSSKYILTAPNAHGIDSTAPSAGSRHRTLNAVVIDDGSAAMRAITVEQVLAKVDELFPT